MNTQLHLLTAAALITMALYSAQAFAATDTAPQPDTMTAAAQDIQTACGYDFDPTDPDSNF
jgi:hypothetical protein